MPLMPTEALLDVNVVIAAIFADHVFVDEGTATCRLRITRRDAAIFQSRPGRSDSTPSG